MDWTLPNQLGPDGPWQAVLVSLSDVSLQMCRQCNEQIPLKAKFVGEQYPSMAQRIFSDGDSE